MTGEQVALLSAIANGLDAHGYDVEASVRLPNASDHSQMDVDDLPGSNRDIGYFPVGRLE